MYFIDYSASLSHHGVKGMKWGVRKKEQRYKSLRSTNGDIIKKGSTLNRISSNKNESHSGSTYTTVNKNEWKNYVDVVAFDTGKAYKYNFIAKKDLRGPSEKERVDTFIEMAKNKKTRSALEKAMRKGTIL